MKLTQTQLFHIATMIVGGLMATLTIGIIVAIALYIAYQAVHL